jgi:hypothetical protein
VVVLNSYPHFYPQSALVLNFYLQWTYYCGYLYSRRGLQIRGGAQLLIIRISCNRICRQWRIGWSNSSFEKICQCRVVTLAMPFFLKFLFQHTHLHYFLLSGKWLSFHKISKIVTTWNSLCHCHFIFLINWPIAVITVFTLI